MHDPDSPLLLNATPLRPVPAPLAKSSFAEGRLLDAVVSCELAPGETISEAIAMERFGLTRAAARAALTRLGYDGWANPMARAGWEILPVTGSLIGQVLEARRVAEPSALSRIRLEKAQSDKLETLGGMIAAVRQQADSAALATLDSFILDAEAALLSATEGFTARHLRHLWQHTARIARHLTVEDAISAYRRDHAPALITAALLGDGAALAAARRGLIDMQEGVFLRALLKNEAALGPGSGPARRPTPPSAAQNGSTI